MCLIFLSVNNHHRYKLIVAGNRDEFYQRKTAPAHFWEDHPDILAGRDLEAGGTWMGISRQGRISVVTNYRDLKNLKPVATSRGHLVSDFLLNGSKPDEYLQEVSSKGNKYNGFNLIVGNQDELHYYSNYKKGPEKISAGLHGLSNHLLNTPWPKVERGKQKVNSLLKDHDVDPTKLFEVLFNEQRAEDSQLPDTGIGLDRERALSSMFIKSPGYGSRCSTVILIDRTNKVYFSERVYDLETFDYSVNSFEFKIE